jgi:glycerophosphoryl diester phosphodiesterase
MFRLSIPLVFMLFCVLGSAQTLVIAHRGASAYEAENSLKAFEKAIEMGSDMIECDLHQTSDGIVVVMHDFSVNRTCEIPEDLSKKHPGIIKIKDLGCEEYGKLHLKRSDANPPTLDNVLKTINGRCKLLIELKKGNDLYPDIEKHILKVIADNDALSWVSVIHSFDKKALLEMHQENTGVKLQRLIVFKFPLSSFNFSRRIEKDNYSDWSGVNIQYRFAKKRIIKKLHKQNKTIYVWTVNKKRIAKRMIRRGVDGIITNKPDMVKTLVNNKQKQI